MFSVVGFCAWFHCSGDALRGDSHDSDHPSDVFFPWPGVRRGPSAPVLLLLRHRHGTRGAHSAPPWPPVWHQELGE